MLDILRLKKKWDRNAEDWFDAFRDSQWHGSVLGWNAWPLFGYITDYIISGLPKVQIYNVEQIQYRAA